MLHLQHDLYIFLCYVVPDESSRQSMIETNTFDRLLDSMAFLENNTQNCCHLLVCGDFNSRTSTQPDFEVNVCPARRLYPCTLVQKWPEGKPWLCCLKIWGIIS